MEKKSLKHIDVKGKRVFLRADFNVPLDEKGVITDDAKIRAALPTLRYLIDGGAKIVCASHLRRPKEEEKPAPSLEPVSKRLSELLNRDVVFYGETTGKNIEQKKAGLKEGEILLLENLLHHAGETENSRTFAGELAAGIDLYVNDALDACLHNRASTVGITQSVPATAAGFLLEKEIRYLGMAAENPPDSYVAIVGGGSAVDKIPLITRLLDRANTILIGGIPAYTFLQAGGVDVGHSRIEKECLPTCAELLKQAEEKNVKILLPVDHIAAVEIEDDVTIRMVKEGEAIPDNMMGLDIGMETASLFAAEIKRANLVFWNGPLGVFENETFSGGTLEIARAVAASEAISIVVGNDSARAVKRARLTDKISHVSAGEEAPLEFLAGKPLPGVEALGMGIGRGESTK